MHKREGRENASSLGKWVSCFIAKGMVCLMITDNFQKSSVSGSAAGGCMMAVRNRECFCAREEMHENFLQESPGTDMVKISLKAELLVLWQLGILSSGPEVMLIFFCDPGFLPGLGPQGPLFFSLQGLFCPRPVFF